MFEKVFLTGRANEREKKTDSSGERMINIRTINEMCMVIDACEYRGERKIHRKI